MSRNRTLFSTYNPLEQRRLLAGDVTVTVVDSVLNVVGDGLANEVQISGNDGSLVISGLDTTINGGSSSFTPTESFRFLSIFMGDGNDSVSLDDVAINQNISFYGDGGDDRLTAENTTAWHLHAEGGDGDDVFDLDMSTRRSAYLFFGEGNDVAALQSFSAGRNFKVFAGAGNDTIASDTLFAGRRLEINLEAGDDSLLVAGSTSSRLTASIDAAEGNDLIVFDPAADEVVSLRNRLTVDSGDGDDNVAVAANVTIRAGSSLLGGDGADSISQEIQTNGTRISDFENEQVADLQTLLDTVFATLNDANVDSSAFGGQSLNDPLVVTATQSTLSFTEGGDPVSIDAGLTIDGPSDSEISGSSVAIDGFVSGQDVLAFSNAGGITGSFDEQTGILALTGDDTIANYQAALRAVTFSNDSDAPSTAERTIQISVTADDEVATASRLLNIIATNSAPAIAFSNSSLTATLSQLPVTLDNALVLSDSDSSQLSQAIIQVATGFVSNEDVLEFDAQSGINATYDASTGTLTVSGDADVADYQSFLRNVRFTSSSSTPTTGSRTIRFSVGDGIDTGSEDFTLQLVDDAQ